MKYMLITICVRDEHLNRELFCVRPDQTANIKTKVDFLGKCLICFLKKVIVNVDFEYIQCQPDDIFLLSFYDFAKTQLMIRYKHCKKKCLRVIFDIKWIYEVVCLTHCLEIPLFKHNIHLLQVILLNYMVFSSIIYKT